MDKRRNTMIRRRDVLLAVTASAVAAAAVSVPSVRADTDLRRDKRKPQYQADSPEVQTFYRVNRYPAKE